MSSSQLSSSQAKKGIQELVNRLALLKVSRSYPRFPKVDKGLMVISLDLESVLALVLRLKPS